jgi:hypothetical protein
LYQVERKEKEEKALLPLLGFSKTIRGLSLMRAWEYFWG